MKNLAYDLSSSNVMSEMSAPALAVPVEDSATDVASVAEEITRLRRLVAESRDELLRLEALAVEGDSLVKLARNRELRLRAVMFRSSRVPLPARPG